MRWAAIDFETATQFRDSACAVGVVVVDEGEERYRQSWLIRPPDNRYSPRNVAIHGIRPADTEHAPSFSSVWNEVEHLVGDRPLVAHNAGFDAGVLAASAAATGAAVRARDFWCSVQMARRAWPELGRWNLPSVAAHVGAELDHHQALSDAAACSRVVRACIEHLGAHGLRDVAERLGVTAKECGSAGPAGTPLPA